MGQSPVAMPPVLPDLRVHRHGCCEEKDEPVLGDRAVQDRPVQGQPGEDRGEDLQAAEGEGPDQGRRARHRGQRRGANRRRDPEHPGPLRDGERLGCGVRGGGETEGKTRKKILCILLKKKKKNFGFLKKKKKKKKKKKS